MELLQLTDFTKLSVEQWESVAGEYEAHKVRYLTLPCNIGDDLLWRQKDHLTKLLPILERHHLQFRAAHALWWAFNDLDWPDEAGRKRMVRVQGKWLEIAAGCGARTMTFHPGVRWDGYRTSTLFGKVRKSLDGLLPYAEKHRIIIALENNTVCEIGSIADELSDLVREFNSPWLGLCLDVGHAHVTEGVDVVMNSFSRDMVTCHLHDNDTSQDAHLPPGKGTVAWTKLVRFLKTRCPRLINCEAEASLPASMSHGQLADIYLKMWS